MVREVLERRSDREPVLFQELGHWLGQDYGLKPRAWYGVPFSVFMEAAREAGQVELTTSGGNSYASLPGSGQAPILDEIEDDSPDDDREDDPGLDVRLESLRPEEQRDLFEDLRRFQGTRRGGYLTFRTILSHLLKESVLPRLSEGQIRRLLNDLANRNPPILIRSQRRSKNASGSYTFSAFTLTTDEMLLTGETDSEE